MSVLTVARNTRGNLVLYEQTDIQTPAAGGSNGFKTHLVSSDIAFDLPLEDSEVINQTGNPTIPYQGAAEVKGGFTIQGDPIGMGYYLKWLLGSPTTTGPVSGQYTHVFKKTASSVIFPLSAERFLADITQAFLATGVKLNKVNASMARGQCLKLNFDVVGLNETRGTSVIDAAPFEPAKVKFLASGMVMAEAGVAYALVKKFDFSFDNQLQGLDVLGNSGQFYDFVEGIGMPAGTAEIYIKDGALWDKGKNVTKTSIKMTFTATDGVSTMELWYPEVFMMAWSPKITGGTGPIPTGVVFKPFLDTASEGTAWQVTLVNTQPSYATIPA
jgi:hypothetical protein